MNADAEYTRIIYTNMFSQKAYEVCSSVIGQLSDGWGENSPRYEIYWKFARVMRDANGEVLIAISNKDYKNDFYNTRRQYVDNGFRVMNDTQVKEFFAKMIKKTAMRELRFYGKAAGWKRHNTDTKSQYLNHHEEISIAEVYAIYEILLSRPVNGSKYAESIIASVIGTKRDEAATQHALELADKRRLIELQWDTERVELAVAEKAEIDAIQKKYSEKRSESWNKYQAAISALKSEE